MFSFAKTMSVIGLILSMQLFLPTKAFAMEVVSVVGYRVTINGPGLDGLFRLGGQWTVVIPFPTISQQAPPDDDNHRPFNICEYFDSPNGRISMAEHAVIDGSVMYCLAAVSATTGPGALAGSLGCLVLWGLLVDQMCSD